MKRWILAGLTLALAGSAPGREPPRLAVVIIVDQLLPDYLTKLRPHLRFGLGDLIDRGVVFTDAHHAHAITTTGPGHAVLATGAHPAHSGIVNNRWYDRDRKQGIFAQSFRQFSGRMVSQNRLDHGVKNLKKHAHTFAAVERQYGVPAAVITAFWGLETDFGGFQGDFSTLNSLATLAHDCRRPALFRPQLISALKLIDRGDLPLDQMVGAWAGELGQTQLLPSDYLGSGVDFDGDGRVDLKNSVPDVLATTGNFITALGWRSGQPWLQEVVVPAKLPWDQADLAIKHPRAQWAKWGVEARGGSFDGSGEVVKLTLKLESGVLDIDRYLPPPAETTAPARRA